MTCDSRFPIVADTKAKMSGLVRRCGNPEFLAACLWEYNMWRRGEGKYAWSMDPLGSKDPPMSPEALGMVISMAALTLSRVGGGAMAALTLSRVGGGAGVGPCS